MFQVPNYTWTRGNCGNETTGHEECGNDRAYKHWGSNCILE